MTLKRQETVELPPRSFTVKIKNKEIHCGSGKDLMLITGPCVIDSKELIFEAAERLTTMCAKLKINMIFKSSYEKDNRGASSNWRGPMAEQGLKILAEVREKFNVPVLTDVHRVEDVAMVAEYVDVLQIPAYMCQQTSLVLACGETGKPVNVKKGQFLAPEGMQSPMEKIHSTGNKNVLLTERGACFGYNRLVADMRSIPVMQQLGAPACFDATHVVRMYGISSSDPAGGEPRFVPHLTLAAVAAGADALFLECHPRPMTAKCDAASQLDMNYFENLVQMAINVRKAIVCPENVGLMKI